MHLRCFTGSATGSTIVPRSSRAMASKGASSTVVMDADVRVFPPTRMPGRPGAAQVLREEPLNAAQYEDASADAGQAFTNAGGAGADAGRGIGWRRGGQSDRQRDA